MTVPSPPGSGKSRLVALLAATLADQAGLRVGVAAQTRDQAVELAHRIGAVTTRAVLGWVRSGPLPDLAGSPVAVVRGGGLRFPGSGGGVVIATTSKWLVSSPGTLGCDVMLVDEAWQATYADIGALGAFAAQVACIGDPGQIDPVVTGATGRWQDSPVGPHLPAPHALVAAHARSASVLRLRHTWRLGPETTALVQPVFYPDLPFTSKRPPESVTLAGRVLPELTARAVAVTQGPEDPALIGAAAAAARALLGAEFVTRDGARPLTGAVVCPHVAQTAAVRAMLADVPGVLVGTTNAVQGMERPAAVIVHPLAGYREFSGFALDLGRALRDCSPGTGRTRSSPMRPPGRLSGPPTPQPRASPLINGYGRRSPPEQRGPARSPRRKGVGGPVAAEGSTHGTRQAPHPGQPR